jgi:DNA mismatch repair ATPase MutS
MTEMELKHETIDIMAVIEAHNKKVALYYGLDSEVIHAVTGTNVAKVQEQPKSKIEETVDKLNRICGNEVFCSGEEVVDRLRDIGYGFEDLSTFTAKYKAILKNKDNTIGCQMVYKDSSDKLSSDPRKILFYAI